jgi:hypothetical protein
LPRRKPVTIAPTMPAAATGAAARRRVRFMEVLLRETWPRTPAVPGFRRRTAHDGETFGGDANL